MSTTTSSDFDTISAKTESEFNRTRNIMIASFVSFVILTIVAGVCSSQCAKRAHRHGTWIAYTRTSCSDSISTPHDDGATRVTWGPPTAIMASSTFNYNNSNDGHFSSDSFAQVVTIDTAPSTPAFENSSSTCAPTTSSSDN
ncbi:hypothetical protein FI667_g11513, partial [Globisporangium splendens]